jgi:hypothetical protein
MLSVKMHRLVLVVEHSDNDSKKYRDSWHLLTLFRDPRPRLTQTHHGLDIIVLLF